MRRRATGTRVVIAVLSVACVSGRALAQGASVDVSAGRVVYDAVSVNVGTSNLMGTLRHEGDLGSWVSGTAAVPMQSGDPSWGAFSAGARLSSGAADSAVDLGADVDGHAFLFRDRTLGATGRGGAASVMPFVGFTRGAARFEIRGGWRGQTLSLASTAVNRGVLETGGRAIYGGRVRAQADLRWVRASEGTFPFVGGSVTSALSPLQWTVHVGRWLDDAVDGVDWGAGIAVAFGATTLWAGVRQEAPDPLYWNEQRRSWSAGVTRRLGRRSPPVGFVPPREGGLVLIRLPAREARLARVFVAGDFSQWQAIEMQRDGDDWVARVPLAPGAYSYAFRSGEGEWFVPPSTPGRRSDGMGGHLAVLVVE